MADPAESSCGGVAPSPTKQLLGEVAGPVESSSGADTLSSTKYLLGEVAGPAESSSGGALRPRQSILSGRWQVLQKVVSEI